MLVEEGHIAIQTYDGIEAFVRLQKEADQFDSFALAFGGTVEMIAFDDIPSLFA